MPIIVACPSCKMRLKAPDSAVGRAFVCPSCKAKVAIAAPVPAAAPGPASPAAPHSSGTAANAPAPARSPKIKVIDKPLLRQPTAPTRLTVVGEADQVVLPPQPPAPAPPPTAAPAPAPSSRATPMPRAEEVFSDFEVVDEDEATTELAQDDGPLDELEEVPEDLDLLDEVEPSSPLDLSRLLAHAVVRLTKKPPPGIAYKLASADGDPLAMAIAVPLPGTTSKIGGPAPIRLEVREGDDEVLRANVQPLRSDFETIEVMGPGDERLAMFAFDGWAALRQAALRIIRPGRPPLQLVPQPARRRAVLVGPDGRELGELVPGNGAWFVPGGIWEARFGPALAGRNEERLVLVCVGLGLELRERQREN